MDSPSKITILSITLIMFLAGVQAAEPHTEDEIIEIENTNFWKFYSPTQSLDNPSNTINVVFNNTDNLENKLLQKWNYAEGADRYAYINQTWREESYQLEKGDYFGTRHHIRVYEADNIAISQAHFDTWNWFRLRHEVTNKDASNPLKSNFENLKISEIDEKDGWSAILITFMTSAIVGTLITTPRAKDLERKYRDQIMLFSAPIIILLTARILSITIERVFSLHPYLISTLFYIFIVASLPLAAYMLSKNLNEYRATATTTLGFISGLMLDYMIIGTTIPLFELLNSKLSLIASLGLISFNSAKYSDSNKNVELQKILLSALWIVILVITLLRP